MAKADQRGASAAIQRGRERLERLRSDPVFVIAQFVLVAKIALVLFAFDPFAADTFSLVKSTLSHAAGWAIAALLLALFARHRGVVFSKSRVHVAAAAVVVTFALATVFALDPTVALFGTSRRFLGLTHVLDEALVYTAAVMLIPTAADLRRIFVGLAAIFAPVIAYGLLQHLGLDVVRYAAPTIRPISSVGQPDVLAGLLSIGVSTLAAVLVLRWTSMSAGARVALGVLAVLGFAVLAFTEVRNAILGLAGGLSVLAILWLRSSSAGLGSRMRCVGSGYVIAGALKPFRSSRQEE